MLMNESHWLAAEGKIGVEALPLMQATTLHTVYMKKA